MAIVGEIRAFAFDSRSTAFVNAARAGWIPCDGRGLSCHVYPELSEAIRTNWGSPNPGIEFCVPNLFGSFLRGASNWGTGTIDPEVSERKPPRAELQIPGNSGLRVGSYQEDSYKLHNHDAKMEIGAEPTSGRAQAPEAAGAHGRRGTQYTSTGLVVGAGGKETRPKNHYVLYMIFSGKTLSASEAEELARGCVDK